MVDQLSGNDSIIRCFALRSATRRTIPVAATARARHRRAQCATCLSKHRKAVPTCTGVRHCLWRGDASADRGAPLESIAKLYEK